MHGGCSVMANTSVCGTGDGSSILLIHPTREYSLIGKAMVSKTINVGSNPATPAKYTKITILNYE